jgi:hypothetical protein
MIQELLKKRRRGISVLTMLLFLVFTNGYSMPAAHDELVNDDFSIDISQEEGSITQKGVFMDTDYETIHANCGEYSMDSSPQGEFFFKKGTQVLFSGHLYSIGQGVYRLDLVRNGVLYNGDFQVSGVTFTPIDGGGDLAAFYETLSSEDIYALQRVQATMDSFVYSLDKTDVLSKAAGGWGCAFAWAGLAVSVVGLAVACVGTAGIGCVLAFGAHWIGIGGVAASCS